MIRGHRQNMIGFVDQAASDPSTEVTLKRAAAKAGDLDRVGRRGHSLHGGDAGGQNQVSSPFQRVNLATKAFRHEDLTKSLGHRASACVPRAYKKDGGA